MLYQFAQGPIFHLTTPRPRGTKVTDKEMMGTRLRVPQPRPDPTVYGFNGVGVQDVLRPAVHTSR